jgi:hypothetical protein
MMNSKILHMDQEGKLIEEFRLTERYLEFIGLWGDNFILSKSIWPAAEEMTGKVFDIPVKILLISKEEKIIKECPGIPMQTFLSPNMAVGMGRSITIMSGDGQACYISDPDEYMISVLDLEKLEFVRKFKRNYPRVKRPKSKPSPQTSTPLRRTSGSEHQQMMKRKALCMMSLTILVNILTASG